MKTCALALFTLALSAQTAPFRTIGTGVNLYSFDKEVGLGKRMAENVLNISTPTSHAAVNEYVQRLADRIAAQMLALPEGQGNYFLSNLKLAVIAEKAPDALPGDYVFISEQQLLAAQDESQFALTLAHVMAHTAARHATRMLTKSDIAKMSDRTNPGMEMFWRDFEREADALAAKVTTGFIASNEFLAIQRSIQNELR
jgi:predicted Zn-dependent protease